MKNLLGGIAGGVCVGIGLPIVLGLLRVPEFELAWAETFVAGLGLILMWYGAVAVHEAGHVVAGMAAAFRPYLVVVGPLKLERTPDGWQASVNRLCAWIGGFAAGLPRGAERLRQRLLLMIVGGPLASAVATALGIGLYAVIRPSSAELSIEGWRALPFIWCLGFATTSMFLLVLSLVPTEHQGFVSDGGRILRFMKQGDDVDADVAVLTLCSASMAGQRPRDWEEAVVARTRNASCDPARSVVGAYLAHWHALDRGDFVVARAHLATALEHRESAPPVTRACVAIQAAKFHAAFAGDTATAREWLTKAAPITAASEPQRLIAEAAIAVVCGAPNASDLISRAMSEVARAQDRGCAVADMELLERFRLQIASAAV